MVARIAENFQAAKTGRGICNESKDKEDFHDGGGSSGVRLLRRYV